jgi:peptide/nickel transport system substrate-binding protein
MIIPALVPLRSFGYDPALAPYPFDAGKARHLLREAGYPEGLSIALIAPEALEVQATVVSKMLEQLGLTVQFQLLEASAYNRKTHLNLLDQPPELQTWDIALASEGDNQNFPVYLLYHFYALDGPNDWVSEEPELRRLYEQVLGTVDRERQEGLIRQMERHTRDRAYFLSLYNPIQLYAVNKGVAFVPYVNTRLLPAETGVTEQHWSVRQAAKEH